MQRVTLSLIIALGYVLSSSTARGQLDALRNLGKAVESSKQIAYFKIKGDLVETPSNLPPLFGQEAPLSLKVLLERFKEARQDNKVVAVVLDLQEAALGLAQLEEVHQALRQFSAVDKQVFVHADILSTLTYAAATGASHISVVPTGDVWLIGLYGETPYLRGALDKLGCLPDFEQCGDFKTGAEPITRTGPSENSKRMIQWLVDGIYNDLVSLMAKARNVSPEKVRGWIDGGPYTAEEALAAGLIDSVKHRQDFIADLKTRYGSSTEFVTDYGKKDAFAIPDDNFFALFEFLMNMFKQTPKAYTKPSVALVYVEGTIQTGEQEVTPFGSTEGAFSTTLRRALDKAAEDDSVKAVVLRVDSPGGSALASEIILNATRRVSAKKPLVVSMGNVAGSGGYYVTCGAETIFAQASTITASIGVFGGKLVTTSMWDKLGIHWHPTQRGQMAGIFSSASPFTDAERAKVRRLMTTVYDTFKKHVTGARRDRLTKPIDEIAGGRVFTGAQALELGLVDKIGGLEDAIKFAAQRAGIGEYEIRVIPEPMSIFDLFLGEHDQDDEATHGPSMGGSKLWDGPLFSELIGPVKAMEPLRARAIIQALQRIELFQRENVLMMMPTDLVIR